ERNQNMENLYLYTVKQNLVVADDNSTYIRHLNQSDKVLGKFNEISTNTDLTNKFNIVSYAFGNELTAIDSLQFNSKQTNIYNALSQLSQIHKETIAPIILITDGNQTYGNDYELSFKSNNQPVITV